MDCHIQIFLDDSWETAAIFEPDPQTLDRGVAGGGRLQYDIDYAASHLGSRAAELYPELTVGFELYRFAQWPPFLVDLMPGGAGRRAWVRRMQAESDGPQMDWHMLTKGAGTPPGNMRIAEAVLPPPPDRFKTGFPRRDIIEQREHFLDYAEERGAHVAGASSVQGEAPKYLLAEDYNGMFHAEGSLPDESVKKFWLAKFPRGSRSDKRNQQVLRNEAPYLEVARAFGVHTGAPLIYEDDVLFVPRFDRKVTNGRVARMAMHSLYVVADIPGYGVSVRQGTYCRALANVVTDPGWELREYLRRDILNLALRNTDNHGRNTAILRTSGKVGLSPLYDFAPMFLDPAGIGRVSRWEDEQPGSQPDWAAICERLGNYLAPIETREWIADMADSVKQLPETMRACKVEDELIDRLAGWIDEVAAGLTAARPRTIN